MQSAKPFAASPELEAFILSRAPAHYATPRAPHTLAQLHNAAAICARTRAPLPVFDGGCNDTIYSSPAVNHAFRAWHDAVHVELDAGFNAEGEQAVALRQFHEVGLAGLSGEDQQAIWADVWGQFRYAENHGGEFPANQAAFVAAFMAGQEPWRAEFTF